LIDHFVGAFFLGKDLGFLSKRPARVSSSSSDNMAPIVIRTPDRDSQHRLVDPAADWIFPISDLASIS
jgi:hypothetical protein